MKSNSFSFILILGLLLSCSKRETVEVPEPQSPLPDLVTLTDEQIKNAGIITGAYSEENISATIEASGRLEAPPQNIVTISAPFPGFIKSMDLLQGMKVNKGQVVIQLQHPDYIVIQENYHQQKSELEFLEAEYNRQQELAKDNINAQKTVQSAKSNYEIAKGKADGLKARLNLMNLDLAKVEKGEFTSIMNIYAPFNGFVTEVNVNLGQFVNPNDVILKIVDNRHLHAELRVFEKDIFRIKPGQTISFVLNGDTEIRKASVYLIGKEITADRTITIHGHLEKEDPDLLPGMFLTAEIETKPEKSVVVPEDAIVSFEGDSFVFMVQGKNQFKMIKVETGISRSEKTEVKFPENVNARTPLVLKGAYSLLSVLKNTESED